MPKRNAKGLAARLGSLFGKKPERQAFPHIDVVTESEARHHVSGSKRSRVVHAHSPAALKSTGKILKAKSPDAAASSDEDVSALEDEEGFMRKVKKAKNDIAPREGVGMWTMMRDRFSREKKSAAKPQSGATEKAEAIVPTEDAFLKHASAASAADPAVRTESAFSKEGAVASPAAASALDEAAAPARRVEKEAATRKEVAAAKKENADIKEEPQAQVVTAQASAAAKKKVHAPQFQTKKGFKAFLTSINYIGMGKERMSFIQNLATMLNAGLPLTDALKTLVLETRNKPMRKLLGRIIDAVENGSPLWRAMEAQNFFSLHALALVRIGEEAGSLAENMGYLAEQDEKDHALRSKVKMAMIYPTIVMVIMFIIVVGLGMFVLPNLVGVLFSLNVKLPLVTRIVIWFSDAFVAYGTVGVPSSIGVFIFIGILSKYTSFRVVTQWIMFRIPGIGRLAKEATIARFGVILGGLLKAGVPVIEALQSLVQVTPIASYKRLYSELLARVTVGDSFQKSFAGIKGSQKLLPASVQQLVITGEKSGSLADIMLKVADIYDKKATETAEKLPIILEPILLLFIGGLVGSIAFAIIIPIYSIVGNVGGS